MKMQKTDVSVKASAPADTTGNNSSNAGSGGGGVGGVGGPASGDGSGCSGGSSNSGATIVSEGVDQSGTIQASSNPSTSVSKTDKRKSKTG